MRADESTAPRGGEMDGGNGQVDGGSQSKDSRGSGGGQTGVEGRVHDDSGGLLPSRRSPALLSPAAFLGRAAPPALQLLLDSHYLFLLCYKWFWWWGGGAVASTGLTSRTLSLHHRCWQRPPLYAGSIGALHPGLSQQTSRCTATSQCTKQLF